MANCDRCRISNEAAPSGVLVHVDRYDREKNKVLRLSGYLIMSLTLESTRIGN